MSAASALMTGLQRERDENIALTRELKTSNLLRVRLALLLECFRMGQR